RSAPGGEETIFDRPVFRASDAPDTDGDGLPGDIEGIIGLNAQASDTDHDGIDDFAEIDLGLDPFGGSAFPTGVISTLPRLGSAMSVTAESDTAYVATGAYGMAIVDVAHPALPIVLGQIDLGGNAVDVAVDPARSIAVVAAATSLHVVNLADPMVPTLIR